MDNKVLADTLNDIWNKIDKFQLSQDCDEAAHDFLSELKTLIEKTLNW